MQQPGARYGIWGVPASTERMAPVISQFEHAMTSARGVNDLFGQYYKNKLEGANANFRQGEVKEQQATMADKIAAMNTKNQTDTQLYPQMQQAKLQQEQQMIKEIMARTGLSHAQAKVAMAHLPLLSAQTQHAKMMANPMAEIQSAYKAYQAAPQGSPEKALYQAHIASMMTGKAGGMGAASSPLMTSAISQIFPDMKIPQGMMKNPAFGSQRSGAGGTYTDPQTGQIISTPTNANTTQNQRTIMAVERVTPLIKEIAKKLGKFQTIHGKGKLGIQMLGNLFGGNNPLPNEYAEGQEALKLAPESLLKAYGLNPTNESLARMEDALKPRFGESDPGVENRLLKTLKEIAKNSAQAQQAQASGYNVTPGQPQQQSQGLSGDDIDRLSQETGMSREEIITKLRNARGR